MMEQLWKIHPITKTLQGHYNITNTGPAGTHPYNVCPREIDPAGIYDIAEVAAFWDALPEGDPRKQIEEERIEEEQNSSE